MVHQELVKHQQFLLLLLSYLGIGKMSFFIFLFFRPYSPEPGNLFKNRVLELNASDERGIDVIRKKVKLFAGASVSVSQEGSKNPSPAYKIIILDEADSMTVDAQHALRRIIETYSNVTRFCLICNYVSRIIDPLTSRTAKFRFRPLKSDLLNTKLKEIVTLEGLECQENVINQLIEISGGDMRKAITYLQSAYRLYGKNIQVENILEMSGNIPINQIKDFFQKCCHSKSFSEIQMFVEDFVSDGFPANQIISQLHDEIMPSNDMNDVEKALILKLLAETDKSLIDGANEYLQLLNVASFIMKIFSKKS